MFGDRNVQMHIQQEVQNNDVDEILNLNQERYNINAGKSRDLSII